MTVGSFIKALQKFDPNLPLVICIGGVGGNYIPEVSIEAISFDIEKDNEEGVVLNVDIWIEKISEKT